MAGPKGRNVEHEEVISGVGAAASGSLADALRASRDAKSDRAQAVVPDADECKTLKMRAKARVEAAARARAAKAKAAATAKAKAKAAAAKSAKAAGAR